ncbi:GPW/gp25 family protein [Roseibium litorale]|uniref:GPW/gp25 family protein n=1 Tax=Roseibium litorale TaxID=2803841 RepID=A0ABR9CJG4_9HYPH|nr:GPW/gp25 family protein [Roseibium litorale]MBD8890898.1 GPW/gp25 family protein [Roseibium litorale]
MAGFDAATGRPLSGDDRIAQAIRRLLVTEHSLVMRRDLACALPRIIGAPGNPAIELQFCAAVAEAIHEYEPRVDLISVAFTEGTADGERQLSILATSRETGNGIDLSAPVQ